MSKSKYRFSLADRNRESELLLEYAAPMLGDAESADEVRFSLGLAIMIWNAYLLDWAGRRAAEDDIVAIMTPTGDTQELVVAQNLYEKMYQRRHEMFSDRGRFVADFEVTEDDQGRIGVQLMFADAACGTARLISEPSDAATSILAAK